MQTTTLRPGYLVSLKTSITGNISYARRDIVAETYTGDGKKYAQWETAKTVNDPEEHERAESIRSKAASLIRGICARSAFGLLCPESMAEELDKAIVEARELANVFNATARITQIRVYVMTGKVAPDDVEAMRAINSEVRDLLEQMAEGCRNLEVKKIRDAAAKARELGSMLTDDAAKRIATAVDAVRATARRIVQAGETAAVEVDNLALKRIAEARTAFLDLDDATPVQAPTAEGRALDLMPEPTEEAIAAAEANLAEQANLAAEMEEETIAAKAPEPAPKIRVPQFALEF